jgi:hypothetical protein
MDTAETTETPPEEFGGSLQRAMHDTTLIILAILVSVFLIIANVKEGWKEEWDDGYGVAYNIILVLLHMDKASVHVFLLSAYEAYVVQKTKACCTNQQVNPRMEQTGFLIFGWRKAAGYISYRMLTDVNGKDHVKIFKSIMFNLTRWS